MQFFYSSKGEAISKIKKLEIFTFQNPWVCELLTLGAGRPAKKHYV